MISKLTIKRALISVSDKADLEKLVTRLAELGVELISTGNTAKIIRELGYPVTEVSELTQVPEMLDGRVKTLHPKIHAGILADKSNPKHLAQLAEFGIATFDLVVINLYPFEQTVAKGADFATSIENIDIGGPAMVRGAAKNFASIAVVTNPKQYQFVLEDLVDGAIDYETRVRLAKEAFAHTANYDQTVASWFVNPDQEQLFVSGVKVQDLRYGENPQQKATLYRTSAVGIAAAKQLQGKELSFNNFVDADAAWRAVNDHLLPTVAIIKHTNPSGIASANSIYEAYKKAHECDPVSAFGSVIASNFEIDESFATANVDIFTEVIVSPKFSKEALNIFSTKKNLRLLQVDSSAEESEFKFITGGFLKQETDSYHNLGDQPENWKLVSGEVATDEQLQDLSFAWRCVRAVKSNAIILARGLSTVGIGMGQVNRVDSVRLAVSRAGNRVTGTVAASDAFFPFEDGVKELIAAGVKAIVQPGGSVKDAEVIEAAQQAGITMYLTGVRHFWH